MKHTWKMLKRAHIIIKVWSQITSFSTLKILSSPSLHPPLLHALDNTLYLKRPLLPAAAKKNGPKQHSNPFSKVKLLDSLSEQK